MVRLKELYSKAKIKGEKEKILAKAVKISPHLLEKDILAFFEK